MPSDVTGRNNYQSTRSCKLVFLVSCIYIYIYIYIHIHVYIYVHIYINICISISIFMTAPCAQRPVHILRGARQKQDSFISVNQAVSESQIGSWWLARLHSSLCTGPCSTEGIDCHIYIYIYLYVNIHFHNYLYASLYPHICIYIHIHIYICIYIYIHYLLASASRPSSLSPRGSQPTMSSRLPARQVFSSCGEIKLRFAVKAWLGEGQWPWCE